MVKKSFLSRIFGRSDESEPQTSTRHRAANGSAAHPSATTAAPEARRDRVPERGHAAAERASSGSSLHGGQGAQGSTSAPGGPAASRATTPPRPGEPPRAPSRPDVVDAVVDSGDGSDERIMPAQGPAVPAREMSRQEEVSLRLKEGFQGINQVLSGIDRKIDQQQKHSEELMVSVKRIPEMMKDVPDASRAGVELLATISTILERQGRVTAELLDRVGQMPKALESLEQRLAAQSQSGDRALSAAQKAAERGAQKAEEAAAALLDVRGRVEALSAQQGQKQDELLAELRRQQLEADRRTEDLLQKSRTATKVMIFLVVLTIGAFLLVVHALSGA